ncbi:MAG: alpha/beta hydrolase [Phenylobacterium sp.]|uniref:alpha/beta fold hydrolase n=3 Tax=Phenylobacterium sp. TaxID=1871053 RepID=UPI002717666B|nr:alpha/beta hydrolase [Phenylobacterium sp.]MDO8913138.1 alpha/beta hydrolase [Phenylobacterium sp.]MDP2009989.1 alpha/beta hydrolase [Phenylobacterium sp.]MDP3102478.1 alpha/beta hydrolase [Phenylobacterium sp.]MDP3870616.1 alpha/beta hydrolase [Phenylobacterium sp.]
MYEPLAAPPRPTVRGSLKGRRTWALTGLATAIVLAGVGVFAAYRLDIAAAEARVEGRSTVVQSPYGPIEYAVVGQGPPVLAIHGSGGGFDQGLDMMEPLAKHGYRLISPSRFGYLRSGRPRNASPAVQADALAWLVSHLGEGRVIVAGGSAGSLPAMQFALRHPEQTRALVLLVPAAYSPDRKPNESGMGGPVGEAIALSLLNSDFLFWAATKLAPGRMTQALLATNPALVAAAPPAEQQRVAAILAHILPVSRRAAGLIDDTTWAGAPPPYPLERISAPTIAVSFEDDLYGTYAAAKYASERVQHGTLVSYPTGGHVWVGHDAEVWSAVAAFLSAHAE